MGTFQYRLEVGSADETRFESVEAWVDSGASYTWLPRTLLRRLGLSPTIRRRFRLANGQVIERDLCQAPIRIGQETLLNLIVFGDEGSEPLIGAFTLEAFSLGIDPVNKTLIPVLANALTLLFHSEAPPT